jgi:hypothetical protein
MRINRRSIVAGLTVGVLAGGAGGAIAATTSGARTALSSSTRTATAGGWDGYGAGWGGASGWGGATRWGDPAAGRGWGGWGNDSNLGALRWTSLARSGRQAALRYLGLSASQLRSRLQSGKTLAEIASSQGKSAAGLERAIETALANSVSADSALSASQKASIIASLKNAVDSAPTGTWEGRPADPMAGGAW